MIPRTGYSDWIRVLTLVVASSGCADSPGRLLQPAAARPDAVKSWDANASTTWNERARLEGISAESGLSRIYGGIHYRFDVEAGGWIGAGAAALALAGSLE